MTFSNCLTAHRVFKYTDRASTSNLLPWHYSHTQSSPFQCFGIRISPSYLVRATQAATDFFGATLPAQNIDALAATARGWTDKLVDKYLAAGHFNYDPSAYGQIELNTDVVARRR
jgi:hypothetical protein